MKVEEKEFDDVASVDEVLSPEDLMRSPSEQETLEL